MDDDSQGQGQGQEQGQTQEPQSPEAVTPSAPTPPSVPSPDEGKPWIDDDSLEALNMEKNLNGETDEQVANRLLREALPVAVASLTKMALHCPTDRIRFEAAKYIIERNMGRVTDAGSTTQVAPWDALLAEVVSETEPDAAPASATR